MLASHCRRWLFGVLNCASSAELLAHLGILQIVMSCTYLSQMWQLAWLVVFEAFACPCSSRSPVLITAKSTATSDDGLCNRRRWPCLTRCDFPNRPTAAQLRPRLGSVRTLSKPCAFAAEWWCRVVSGLLLTSVWPVLVLPGTDDLRTARTSGSAWRRCAGRHAQVHLLEMTPAMLHTCSACNQATTLLRAEKIKER